MPISISSSPMVKVSCRWNCAGRQRDAHRADVRQRLRGNGGLRPSSEPPRSAIAPAILKAKTIPVTFAAVPLLQFGLRQHRRRLRTVRTSIPSKAAISCRHIEVHHVAAIVAVNEHSLAPGCGGDLDIRLNSARSEHIPDRCSHREALRRHTLEDREMPRPATGRQCDFPSTAYQLARCSAHQRRQNQAYPDGLLSSPSSISRTNRSGIVEDLLHRNFRFVLAFREGAAGQRSLRKNGRALLIAVRIAVPMVSHGKLRRLQRCSAGAI